LTHEIARYIDHTLLKPEANRTRILQVCEEARAFRFAAVCVNPTWVPLVRHALRDEPEIAVCTVVGFPLGANFSDVKMFETRQVIEQGATEVDMVINIGLLKSGDDAAVLEDMVTVVNVCKESRIRSKIIIETAVLSAGEKERACRLVAESGADFIKTSTGFAGGGATIEDIELMHRLVHSKGIRIKASGGIRSAADALSMIHAGADRIGTSSGVKIIEEALEQGLSI
jgi:deoxyribose-phosphate aldolase